MAYERISFVETPYRKRFQRGAWCSLTDMQEDLDKERKTMTKLWAKRQEQIRCVIESTAGMYGDMQGIAGKTLQEIEGLDMKVISISSDSEAHA